MSDCLLARRVSDVYSQGSANNVTQPCCGKKNTSKAPPKSSLFPQLGLQRPIYHLHSRHWSALIYPQCIIVSVIYSQTTHCTTHCCGLVVPEMQHIDVDEKNTKDTQKKFENMKLSSVIYLKDFSRCTARVKAYTYCAVCKEQCCVLIYSIRFLIIYFIKHISRWN